MALFSQQRTTLAFALATTVGAALTYRNRKKRSAPDVAPHVDLERYLGKLYEITRLKLHDLNKNTLESPRQYICRDA